MHKTTDMSDISKSPTCFGMLQVPSSGSVLCSGLLVYDTYGVPKHVGDSQTFLYVCCAVPVLDLTEYLYQFQNESIFLGDFFAVDVLFIFVVLQRICVQQACLIHRFVCHGFAYLQKNIVSTFVRWGAVFSLDKLAIGWVFLQVLCSLLLITIQPIIHTHCIHPLLMLYE